MKTATNIGRALAGFSLVEVTLALGITAFGLATLMALLPVGLKSNQSSIEQTAANDIVSAIAADLRSTPPTVPRGKATITQRFQIPIPANPVTAAAAPFTLYFSDEGSSAQLQANSRHRVSVTLVPNVLGGNQPSEKQATMGIVDVYWPAAAPATAATGHVQTFTAFDRN